MTTKLQIQNYILKGPHVANMTILRISILSWILILKDHQGNTLALTRAPEHTLKKCIQDKNGYIECQNFEPETMDVTSFWPPGPYVVPMTRYGCPETSMHGWREGYIKVTWQEPHKVHVQSITPDVDFTESDLVDVTKGQFFSASKNHYTFFPATPNTMKLQFCHKHRNNASVDIGSWPDENFSIFGTRNSCPLGFEKDYSNITLPNISRWESDGYLPDFEIVKDGVEDKLQIMMCIRRKSSDNSSFGGFSSTEERNHSDTSLYRNWTSFFLVKNEDSSCPIFQSTVMFEERMYIEQQMNKPTQMLQLFGSLCFYELKLDEGNWLFERRRKHAYSVNIVSITTEGNSTETGEEDEPFFGFIFPVPKKRTTYRWKIVDLGKTIAVSSMDITLPYSNGEKVLGIEMCNSNTFDCFISREKWNFLYSEAHSCLHVHYCRVTTQSASLVFRRIMEGRYLTLFHEKESSVDAEALAINDFVIYVFTELIKYDGSDSCNADLGMQDLNIEDDQITASSWLSGFTPPQSRPYSSGWCSQVNDHQPYLKIVFPKTTIVEGFTISNSREVVSINGLNSFVSFGGSLLNLTYTGDDNSTMNIKTLRTDLSKLDAEVYTFWFLKPIRAKMVKLFIEKEPSSIVSCIRLELHGCRLTDEFLKLGNIYKRERTIAPKDMVAYVSEIDGSGSILTSIGYPGYYESGKTYKWIVRFPELNFIKLVFTRINFHVTKKMSDDRVGSCNDSILISKDLDDVSPYKRVIDHNIKWTYSLTIETKETQLVLTFVSCPVLLSVIRGNGFRAVASHQDIPACFSIDDAYPWQRGSMETCRHPSMLISSMSYLGFQFLKTTEKWTIHIHTRRISLRFIKFNVPCLFVDNSFKIINMAEERLYCNFNKPPDIFNSSFDVLMIIYARGIDNYDKMLASNIDGFRVFYTILEEPEGRLINYRDKFHETSNVALYKSAFSSGYLRYKLYLDPSNLIDGLAFPDGDSGSCLKEVQLDYGQHAPPVWFLIDLRDLYILEYVVLYGGIADMTDIREYAIIDNCIFTLSTGFTAHGLEATGFICGQIRPRKVINQRGIKTRYVKLQSDCNELLLCEVQVYGKLGALQDDEIATEETIPITTVTDVHGEWGLWSAWSDVCYCDGKQYRHRFCDDPKPEYSGFYCPGDNVSHRPCQIVLAPCEVFNGFVKQEQDVCPKNSKGLDGFSSWLEWSSCSSDCGHGLMSRTRTCNTTEGRGNGKHCGKDFTEDKPCIGDRKCLICSNTFSKCYSIISKYSNWQQARLECFQRNMTLVSILSLSEMRFIKFMLRQKRRTDGLPMNYFNADFHAHIGLHLPVNSNERFPVWENGYYAFYFTAWKKREPSSGKCTRMSFKLFDDDNTWESEDCEHQQAEYTICEYQTEGGFSSMVNSLAIWTDDEQEEVPEQTPVTEYIGKMNVTISGKDCVDSFCRDSLNKGYLQCLNGDGYYEECSAKLQPAHNSSVVLHKYLGKLNTTYSGKTCQRWDTTFPQSHNMHGDLFQGEGISDAANSCRDIGDAGFLWCYTIDTGIRWEPCLLNEIKTERKCTSARTYSGTRNHTITGKTCKQWDKQFQSFGDALFSKVNLIDAENFCRDPLNLGFSWCYIDTSYKSEEWEPCGIEDTETVTRDKNYSFIRQPKETFMCSDGVMIAQYLKCDGKFDCGDRADETECKYIVHMMMENNNINNSNTRNNPSSFEVGSFFRCGSGEWITVIAQCDTVIDCLDASDEVHCDFNSLGLQECTTEQFQCDDGDCIHVSLVCNLVDDCIDGSDEYCDFEECSLLTEFRCKSGQCIPMKQQCDAVKQCTDGSDETDCDFCQASAFHCDFALCIPMRLKCDNFEHCEDGTDEMSCDTSDFTSCQDAWEAGYRKTGYYIFDDVQAYCQFDHVVTKGTVETVLEFDLTFQTTTFIISMVDGKFTNRLDKLGGEGRTNFIIFHKYGGNCTQKVIQTCLPTYEALTYVTNDSVCFCGTVNFKLERSAFSSNKTIDICPGVSYNNITLSYENPVLENTDIFYTYSKDDNKRFIWFLLRNFGPFYKISAGPAICKHDFKSPDDDFACNINGKHIPVSERCVYDVDATGFPTGCTDGSHLVNCETYDCPQNTLKCPDSYCIPHKFVCDGVEQCPGGEDERGCGCVPSGNEILIIYDVLSLDGPNIPQFARQFYTRTNVVRVLSYKASKPLQKFDITDVLLEVNDLEINRSPAIEINFQCHYKVFARELLESLHFTNGANKGLIVVQNSEISIEVFRAIIESKLALRGDFRIYRVSQSFNTLSLSAYETTVSNFTDIRVRRWQNLNGIGAEYFSEMCKISTKVHCQNDYKCSSSKSCIPMDQVCDGHKQCLHGDDEVLCDFQCPANCTCTGYFLTCSATESDLNMLNAIPKNTRHLDLSFNRKFDSILQRDFLGISKLSVLNVSGCNIKIISQYAFWSLTNLRSLDLSFNKISILSNFVFASLVHLISLNLRGNSELSIIEAHAFDGLSLIQDLDLANAMVLRVSADTFVGLKLKSIDLSNNMIQEIENYAFRDSFVENINFGGNDIKDFQKEIFTGLVGLKTLKTPAFKFCCIRPNYVPEQDCYPHKDEFSSCDDLMRHSGLQFMIWLIGIMAFLGNALSIIYRIKYDRERLKLGYGIFVTNLAMADFLMSVYLMIIAVADSAFRKRYIYVDDYWRHSVWCNIAGVLSTTSSEASVLFLCFITLDRLLVIKFPFGGVKITTNKATVCVLGAWLFSFFVALLPIAYNGYFKNEFYSKSGVCVALPLTRERPPGWAYSLALFVCLNFVTFVLVAVGQVFIFMEISKSSGMARSAVSTRKRDLKVARNLLLVVATDFLCWFPIGVTGMLALSGHPVSGEVYAWAAVFILPVNSALNPLLYTLSAIIGGKNFNPNTDEQSFNRITKDIGRSSMKCLMIGHCIFPKRNFSMYRDISTLSTENVEITSEIMVKITANIAKSLDTLHSSSLGLNPFDEMSVSVKVLNRKLTERVRMKGEPYISYKSEDKQNDIKQLGTILKSLIAAKQKRSK